MPFPEPTDEASLQWDCEEGSMFMKRMAENGNSLLNADFHTRDTWATKKVVVFAQRTRRERRSESSSKNVIGSSRAQISDHLRKF